MNLDRRPYGKKMPWWLNSYCVLHFLIMVAFSTQLGITNDLLPFYTLLAAALYVLYSMTTFGLMFEHRY